MNCADVRARLAAYVDGELTVGEIAAVRLEEHGLEALDVAVLLQAAVVTEDLVEEVDGLLLATARHGPPTDEEPCIGHVKPPSCDAVQHGTSCATARQSNVCSVG